MPNNTMTHLPQGWEIKNFNDISTLLELSSLGSMQEIINDFGGISALKESIEDLQREIYLK
ncbi:hypothetical protein [Helicobacter equorum]|uniref:hypothetical protein n=1 Tax=Helicobacter equorum TaxID=361872 RepID=UPI000CF0525C|nr:hypothetical protein [Helicobacter equorum]